MGARSGRKFLGLLLIVAFPASTILADSNAAMLYAKGAVAVNGVGANRSSAVFVGDKIQTTANSSVTISSAGSTLIVPASSSVVYQGSAVEIGSGAVQINTTRNMSARVDEFTVTPAADGSATFQVTKTNGSVTVAAERGAVVVSDGEKSTVVKEGTTQTASDSQNPPEKGDKKKRKRRAILLVGGGSGAAVGAALAVSAVGATTAIVTTGPPESPSSPHR